MACRYWSTQRPVSIGTYPRPKGNEVVGICSFGARKSVPEISREAWGWVEYEEPLLESTAESYELVAETELPPYVAVGNRRSYTFVGREVVEGVGAALESSRLWLLDGGDPYRLYTAVGAAAAEAVELILGAYGSAELKPAVRAYRTANAVVSAA